MEAGAPPAMSWVPRGSEATRAPLEGSQRTGVPQIVFFFETFCADGGVGAEGWDSTCAPPGNPLYLGRYREYQCLELLAAPMAGGNGKF